MKQLFLVITLSMLWEPFAASQMQNQGQTAQQETGMNASDYSSQAPWLRRNLLWSQGKEIVMGCALLGAVGLIFSSKIIVAAAVGAFIFSLYFFRNPQRTCEAAVHNDRVLVAPADGKVVEILEVEDGFVGAATRISIFLSPLDVHVQWVPVAGRVEQVVYRPGEFLVAYAPKSSDVNERNDVYLITARGAKVLVRQIAGFVARRICCWVSPQDVLQAGDKYGMIRFGSRVDLVVPRGTRVLVQVGDRVYGGHTVMGELYETNTSAVA